MRILPWLVLALLALQPACRAADFQDEVARPRQAARRLDRSDQPQGVRASAGQADRTWALPASDAELRAAVRGAHAAEAARHPAGGPLPAAQLQAVLLELLNPQRAELSARERQAFDAAVAQWAARQGLGGGAGEGRELSASLLQQQAALKFLRATAAALARVRSEERLRLKARNILEQAQEAAEDARSDAL
jgi:hypothetical protein